MASCHSAVAPPFEKTLFAPVRNVTARKVEMTSGQLSSSVLGACSPVPA